MRSSGGRDLGLRTLISREELPQRTQRAQRKDFSPRSSGVSEKRHEHRVIADAGKSLPWSRHLQSQVPQHRVQCRSPGLYREDAYPTPPTGLIAHASGFSRPALSDGFKLVFISTPPYRRPQFTNENFTARFLESHRCGVRRGHVAGVGVGVAGGAGGGDQSRQTGGRRACAREETRRELRGPSHQSLPQRIRLHARGAGAERVAHAELRLRRARAGAWRVGFCGEPRCGCEVGAAAHGTGGGNRQGQRGVSAASGGDGGRAESDREMAEQLRARSVRGRHGAED